MTDWGCSWSYWMSYRKSGMFQRCSTVIRRILRSKRENKSCKAGQKQIRCECSYKFDLLDVDFMWLAGASLDQYNNNNTNVGSVGSTQNTETASYSYYLPGWAIKSYIKSCRCRGPIVSSPHLGMVGRFCVSFPSSRGSRVDGKCDTRWYKIFGGCVVCVKCINDFSLWPSNIQGRWWFEAIVEVLPSFVP